MNDKVYVKIRGLSAQEAGDAYKEAEDIEIISVGRYTRRAGKEYIRYEEVYDGESAKSDTLIKISEDRVEISKKGAITTIMEMQNIFRFRMLFLITIIMDGTVEQQI